MARQVCCQCKANLDKDIVALNKKLLGRKINIFMCLACLAEYLSCTKDDLRVMIEEFREQGCTLFM